MKPQLRIRSVLRKTTLIFMERGAKIICAISPALAAITAADLIYWYVEDPNVAVRLVKSIIDSVILAIIAITVHRIVLLGPGSVPRYGLSAWTMRETRFLGWWLVAEFYLTVIASILGTILSEILGALEVVGIPFGSLAGFLMGYFFAMTLSARISLLLPSTALDKRDNMRWAFDISRGVSYRLAVLVGIAPTITALLAILILYLPQQIYAVINWAISWLLVVMGIGLLSVSYQALVEPDEGIEAIA